MRVHLIRKETVLGFMKENASSRVALLRWLDDLKDADWRCPEDIKESFGSADILGKGSDRVVFDIGGNHYRMICKYVFGQRNIHLFICWIGTHTEYDELNRKNLQYTIWKY
jgi:mRNA interferase HigB